MYLFIGIYSELSPDDNQLSKISTRPINMNRPQAPIKQSSTAQILTRLLLFSLPEELTDPSSNDSNYTAHFDAQVVELADTQSSGGCAVRRAGSTPALSTISMKQPLKSRPIWTNCSEDTQPSLPPPNFPRSE